MRLLDPQLAAHQLNSGNSILILTHKLLKYGELFPI
jgi:hypothetical protein